VTEPEDILVEQARSDPAAFGQLYQRYVDRIYNYIFHRTGNQHDAEDLTARTFYKALISIATYTDRGVPFSAWLYRIAHNLVANWHRDQNRRQFVALDELLISSPRHAPDHATEQREEERALAEAIRDLAPDRQMLLILKFSEGLSNAEIGRMLGRSEGAVKSLYHRTLLALREDMQRRGFFDDDSGSHR
jgi:RNA polymerase sigma-70 factor (ECF subfamily)